MKAQTTARYEVLPVMAPLALASSVGHAISDQTIAPTAARTAIAFIAAAVIESLSPEPMLNPLRMRRCCDGVEDEEG